MCFSTEFTSLSSKPSRADPCGEEAVKRRQGLPGLTVLLLDLVVALRCPILWRVIKHKFIFYALFDKCIL